jgi:carbonic anhydrase
MEFATKVKGTKLIVVMGHNKCGAIKGAIDNADLGNLTQLVDQIKPAITGNKSNMDLMMNESAKKNVELTIADILKQSPVISDLVNQGSVKIVGAFYDITDGKVIFMD